MATMNGPTKLPQINPSARTAQIRLVHRSRGYWRVTIDNPPIINPANRQPTDARPNTSPRRCKSCVIGSSHVEHQLLWAIVSSVRSDSCRSLTRTGVCTDPPEMGGT